MADRLYLDETGAGLNMTLAYGRSPRGQRVFDAKPVSPGTRVNTIAVLTPDGLQGSWCYTGALNGSRFITYLEDYLLPRGLKDKVLILDNHPVHRSRQVLAFLKQHRIRSVFLPPYSPELNPIEEAWSKFKQHLKRIKPRTVDHLLQAMAQAAQSINPDDALGYLQHVEDFSLVIN